MFFDDENEHEMLIIKRRIRRRLDSRGSYFNKAARWETGKFVCSALEHAYGLGRADAENKKFGVWIQQFADNGWMDNICSCCGFTINEDIHVHIDYDFCPGCGSPMKNAYTADMSDRKAVDDTL